MKCPFCFYENTKVLDSRLVNEGSGVRRRRRCLKCSLRFSTLEEVKILDQTVVKKDGRSEQYSREKLELGLRKAFEKRSITRNDFDRLISRIERDIQISGEQEIKTREIGKIVIKHLKKVDHVAYLRFASVYLSFKDAKTFEKKLKELLKAEKR